MDSDPHKRLLSRRKFMVDAEMGAAGAYLALSGAGNAPAAANQRPNIIFILTDDQRYDAIGCLGNPPWLKTPNMDRLVKEGLLFKNTFCPMSLCAPSRASFLTGKYATRTGVRDNEVSFPPENVTFSRLLHTAGYETAFIGKWHMGRQNEPQPGFDRWVSFVGQGVYNDPVLNVDGKDIKRPGYITDLLNDYALEFLKRKREKPFCLYLAHKAVHDPREPAPRHAALYANETYPLPPSAKYNMEGKPNCVREKSVLSKGQTFPPDPEKWQENTRRYYRCLGAVDDGIGQILKTLGEMDQLKNTVLIFAGDNGYLLGEHGQWDKRFAYEESIRIPFVVYFPGTVKPGTVRDEMILNIDMAPTLLDLAGVPIPSYMQGQSFKPLLQGKNIKWREDFLYHYYLEFDLSIMSPEQKAGFEKMFKNLDPGPLLTPENMAVRTKEWKYITYPGIQDIDELYDLRNDPYEMKNLALDPRSADVLKKMKTRMVQLIEETR
jgi:N-acetylglucosamine-6-sulfatase